MNKQPLIQQIILGMQKTDSPSDYWLTQDLQLEFPELEAVQSVFHRSGQSVWTHTMTVLDFLVTKNPVTLLSGLFHDLGKIKSRQYHIHRGRRIGSSRLSQFPGHDVKSASIVRMRLKEWQASSYLIDRVSRIVASHMYDISQNISEKTIRKFVATVGQDNIENWFVLRKADSASYSGYGQYKQYIIDPFYNAVKEYLDGLSQGDSLLQSNPNITIGGKGYKDGTVFLSIKSADQEERKNP